MIIISNKPGQLGNRLFVFASFIAFAKEFNFTIKNPSFSEYAPYFEKTALFGFQYPSPAKKKKIFSLLNSYKFVYFFARILHRLKIKNKLFSIIYLDWVEEFDLVKQVNNKCLNSKYVFVQGWLFRCDNLVFKYKEHIQEYFKPVSGILDKVNDISKQFIQNDNLLFGVHIRQGDYKTFEKGRYLYSPADYNNQMLHILTLFPKKKIKFIICSNEKQNEKDFPELDVYISNEHYVTDMYLLSRCNYIIGPPSTFSMWASFYGNVPLCMIKTKDQLLKKEDFKEYLNS